MATALEQLACENPEESPIIGSLLAPVRSLLGFSKHEFLFVYAWILVIAIYVTLYYALQLSILNSENGFLSGRRVLISTLIIFGLIVIAYVIWTRDAACKAKRAKAAYYVLGRRPSEPGYLSQAVHRVQSFPENRGRKHQAWSPQEP